MASLHIGGERVACALGGPSKQPALSFRGAVVAAEPPLADAELTPAAALAGSVALARRGGCSFAEKAERAAAAGAVALLVSDSQEATTPFVPGGTEESPIPVLGVRQSAHETLAGSAEHTVLTIADAAAVARLFQLCQGGDGEEVLAAAALRDAAEAAGAEAWAAANKYGSTPLHFLCEHNSVSAELLEAAASGGASAEAWAAAA
jgi:hypothetical protein